MRVAVTGTPGTGKTTATDLVDTDLEVVHLNDLVEREGLHDGVDDERDSHLVDLDAVRDRLADRGNLLVESHLAHHLDADRVAVLRCHPEELERRLEERGEPPGTVAENAESEALDVILAEAVERHGPENVYEIDATDRPPAEVAREIEAAIAGEREPGVGTVSFIDYVA